MGFRIEKNRRSKSFALALSLSFFLIFTAGGGILQEDPGAGTYAESGGATIDLADGSTSQIGTDWEYDDSGKVYTILNGANVTVTGNTTERRIVVASGATADVTLSDASIDVSVIEKACAFDMTGAAVRLTLRGDNVLKSGTSAAALHAPDGAALTITEDSDGSLAADGGQFCAGIGGDNGDGGNITINGGTITTRGGSSSAGDSSGAGVGGGYHGDGGNITINGGTVSASGGPSDYQDTYSNAAGIGGGSGSSGGRIIINGGVVTANGGAYGAGIGGGNGGKGGEIVINGGVVAANGGDYGGVGIGNLGGNSVNIAINGGVVTANGGSLYGGAGIRGDNGGVLTINGGSVSASSIQAQPTDGINPVYLNALTVDDPPVANEPVTAGEIDGVRCTQDGMGGYGVKDVRTDAGGKVYFYLTETDGAEKEVRLSAGGKVYGKSYIRDADDDNAQTLGFLANTVDIAAVPGVAAPVPMAVPVTAVGETTQYTGVVSWSPDPATSGGKFAFNTVYTATITLTAKPDYTFLGVPTDFFTVAGAADTRNARDSGDIEAQFPATDAKPSYTVTFDANGGSAVASRKVTDGAAIGSLPESSRTGYTFGGWYTGRNDGSKVGPDAVVTGDVTYYAHWTAEVYTVTFMDDSKTVKTDRKDYDSELGALPVWEKTGHTLAGWYTAKTGGEKVGPDTKVTGDVTYYAHWTVGVYTVTFKDGSKTVKTYRKDYDSELGALPVRKKKGHTLGGWYTAKTGGKKVDPDTKVAGDVTYYAHWKTNVYKVKFRSGSKAVEIYRRAYGSKLGELPGVKREGYAFKGWYTKPDGGTKIRIQAKITKGVTYYAHWALKASVRNATVVRMHKGPFDASPTVRFATREMRMEYVSRTGNWCRVKAGDTVGYIYGRFVRLG